MDKVVGYINENAQRYIDEMIELLKIPSISADSTMKGETRRAGIWIEDKLNEIGIDNVKLIETGGHPVVYGDWLHAEGKPTILVYGHYDVQPVDPIELWDSPPFEPTIKDGNVYGRGTSDDKCQLLTHVFALGALLKENGELPVNVKFFIEGEEEAGSEHTGPFVVNNKELLACDAVVISDTAWYSAEMPTIVYALRGLCYMEFIVKGPNRDLHSGMYGGMIQNPLNAVGKIITMMQDEDGVIQIPGFYDDVVPATDAERAEFAEVDDPDEGIKSDLTIPAIWGEKGYTSLERNWIRPSLDVNGMWGGFAGEGAKTVIASHGGFKVSCRLVANQSPEKIAKLMADFVEAQCPPGVTVETIYHHGGEPVLVPTDNVYMEATVRAFESVFGKKPALVREGASIPITATFYEELQAPPVLVGYGLPDDNIHSPNEKMSLDNFQKGILCNAHMYVEFGK
jgi:acetylornithine deacetylase/succinyl-diaminopimelate desuccinylase-like protein